MRSAMIGGSLGQSLMCDRILLKSVSDVVSLTKLLGFYTCSARHGYKDQKDDKS